MLPRPPVVCRLVRRRSPSMGNRTHIPKVPPCHDNSLPPAKAMKPICLFLFCGDAARHRRATQWRMGAGPRPAPAYRPQNGNPSTPYNMDAALRLWRSCRPAYRSHLVTAGPHRAENPAPKRTALRRHQRPAGGETTCATRSPPHAEEACFDAEHPAAVQVRFGPLSWRSGDRWTDDVAPGDAVLFAQPLGRGDGIGALASVLAA
jgi:hypothetical protein